MEKDDDMTEIPVKMEFIEKDNEGNIIDRDKDG